MMQRLFGSLVLHGDSDPDHLRRVIGTVRRRWRLRLVLRGLAATGAVALGAFLFSAYSLEQLRFSDRAVLAFQVTTYLIVAAVGFWTLVRPLARRVTDEQVALYLEEHAHELTGQVSSAVEFGVGERDLEGSHVSPALVHRLVERAVESCAGLDDGRRVERPRLTRVSGALTTVMAVGAALMLLRPGFAVHGAPFLLTPWRAEAVSPFTIAVEPGNLELPRGADLQVRARLENFDADDVTLLLRRGDADEWERWSMAREDDGGGWEFLVFNIDLDAEYLVEAGGVRSPRYRVKVRDLPYVDRIDLEYHFPAYTGLAPRVEENTGDIAAVAGTRVRVGITPTIPVAAGALIVDERDTVALASLDGTSLTAELDIAEPGSYRVVLRSADGTDVPASPDYFIDVLDDMAPAVRFTTPGRDLSVTSIDEIFVEVEAEDDFAVRSVELVFTVNGGPEQTIELFGGAGRSQEVTAGHTFYLEEYELVPGDFVSYHARATDRNGVRGPQRSATDIYFLEIRPFDQRFRQAESQGEQGGGGEPGVGELSARQRQLVAATFKLVRDSVGYDIDELRENLTTLTLAQGRLREEVEALVTRMESRGVMAVDSTFRVIAEALPQAIEAMRQAEERLGERKPQAALSPEQVALQYLQRAESAFREREISQQSGGGGGGAQSSNADELADLFELELDKLRNQYERVDRGDRREADQQVDELLEKLEELARRQQQENERMRARAQQENGGSGGGDAQRQLAEDVEEAAGQLERLSREQSQPELQETARELREAAESMRRAAASASSEGTVRGQAALDRLREARRLLDQNRSAGLARDIEDALERAQRLGEQQADVQRDVDRLTGDPNADRERLERLIERKDAMAAEAQDLERQLTGLARDARDDQPDAAGRLRDVARAMRDGRVADKILYSRGVVQERSPEYARDFEEQIEQDLAHVEEGIREALGAVGESREQRLERSLEETRDLVRALESLEDRVRDAAENPDDQASEQQGQAGEQRQGQPGGAPRGGTRGQLSPGATRQFQQELGRRRAELNELREQLTEEGIDVEQLDEIAGDLRSLERLDLGDPRGLALLEESVIAGLKEFEFALRRAFSVDDPERYFTGGADEVPPRYRDLVEEYYRSLSRGR